MFYKTIWIICAGYIAFASAQIPHLPSITHVERYWYVLPTDPIGTVVTKAYNEKTSDHPVTYGIETTETTNPPVPFSIDRSTGIVTVNDCLTDTENRTYSLWVTSYDGDMLQRTEVIASIKDKPVMRSMINIRYQSFLPPSLLPNISNIPEKQTAHGVVDEIPNRKLTTISRTQAYSEVPNVTFRTQARIEASEDTTTIEEKKESIVTEENKVDTISMTVVPLVAICGLVIIVAAVIFFVWRKNNSPSWKSNKIEIILIDNNLKETVRSNSSDKLDKVKL